MRTYDATHDIWVEQSPDIFDWLLKPIDVPDMRKGNNVQHGKPTDRDGLERLAQKVRAET